MSHKPPYIRYVTQIGKKPNRHGLAIWSFVWIKKDAFRAEDGERTLIEHEKIYHEQQKRVWHIGFYLKYLYYRWRYGYEKTLMRFTHTNIKMISARM